MQLKTTWTVGILLTALLLVCTEPVLANKFETIGSGISGSTEFKIEYLKIAAYVTAAIMFIAGVLSIVMRESNAQFLNYTMWKPSSIIFFCLCLLLAGVGVLL
jgi:cytochrome b561